MKWIKYGTITLLTVIAGVTLTLALWLATWDDADYLRVAQGLVFKNTGVKLAVSGFFNVKLGWDAVIQAEGLTVIDPHGEETQPPLVDLQTFKVKLALWPLLRKTLVIKELVLADAVITFPDETRPQTSPARPDSRKTGETAVPVFMPLLEQVRVNRVVIMVPRHGSDLPLKIWLEQFDASETLQAGIDGLVELTGQGRIGDRVCRISGTMGTIETFMQQRAPFPLDITLATQDFSTHARGFLRHGRTGKDLDLRVAGQGSELARILDIFGVQTPPLGRVALHAALTGSVRNPRITDLKLNLDKPSGLNLTVSGEIKAPTRFEKIDLALSGTCRDQVLLKWLLPETVPPVEAIELSGYIREREGSFFLECAPLTITGPQGAQLAGTGPIWVGRRANASNPKNQIDLQLDLQAPSAAALFEADTVPAVLKALKAVKASAGLKGLFKELALEKFTLRAGDARTLAIEATGAVGRIQTQAAHPLSDLIFQGRMTVADPALLAPEHAARLSALGPLRSDFKVVDADGALRLTATRVQVEGPSHLQMAVEGTWSPPGRINFEVNTRTTAADLSALPGMDGISLPDFKTIDLQAKVALQEKRWDATAFEVRCYGEGNEALHIAGNVKDLFGAERAILKVEFAADLAQDVFYGKKSRLNLLEQVQGQAEVGWDAAGYTIKKLAVQCPGLGDITGQLEGTIRPDRGAYSVVLETDVQIGDPETLFAFFGIAHPRAKTVQIKGRVTGNHRKPVFAGRIAWGENQIDTTATVDLRGPKPKIRIDAESKAYQMTKFERRGRATAPASIKVKRKKSQKPRRLFSEEQLDLAAIKDLDLVLRVQAVQLGLLGLNLTGVDLNLSQAGGRLRIDPLVFKYTGGEVDLNFTLDTSKPVPDWALGIKARGISLEELLTDWFAKAQIGGTLNLAVNLESRGKTPRDIAAALTGEVGCAVEQGWVPHNVGLLADDVIDALLTLPKARTRTELNCLVSSFSFEKGIGTSRILSMDTDDFSALGAGTIDLRNETLDLLINPKQKKRLVMGESSPVHIFGPLAKLSFSKMPYREAAKLYGDIIIPVIGISDRVLGYLWDAVKPAAGDQSPCFVTPGQE